MEPKKDLRVIKTETALCDAFLKLLSKKSFESITVQELCDTAMIRRATFYTHFMDIYDFFRFFVHRYQQEFNRQAVENPTGNYFADMYRRTIAFLESQQDLLQSAYRSTAFPTILDIMSEEITQHVLSHLRENPDFAEMEDFRMETLAQFYAGGLVNTLRLWLAHKMTSEEEIRFLADIDSITKTLKLV